MFITAAAKLIRYNRILSEIYRSEKIIENFSSLFETEFRKDWAGRLYTVVHPEDKIYEYTVSGMMSDEMYVEKWIMERLNAADRFIVNHNLFELVTYRIDKIDQDNYLFVIEPIPFQDFKRSAKTLGIVSAIAAAVGIVALLFLL